MDDSHIIGRRCKELESLNRALLADIENAKLLLAENEAELSKWQTYLADVEQLRSARWQSHQPRLPAPEKDSQRASKGRRKKTVGDLICGVLRETGRPMRPVEIDRMIRDTTDKELHHKQVGKECCRLLRTGRLLKDDFTKEYSLPPDLGSDETVQSRSLPNQSPAKGREAVPGGVT